MKHNQFLPDRDAQPFAEELLTLVRETSFRANQLTIYTDQRETEMWSRAGIESKTVPIKYQLVHHHVEKLHMWKVSYCHPLWTCTNCAAANINVDPILLGELIKRKYLKSYEWREGAEKWLLIYASGHAVVARGAPIPDFVDWKSEQLQKCCRESPFERIFFWECIRQWTVRMK